MATFDAKSGVTYLKHDDYMTPKSAWEAIEKYIPKEKVIYEPFYGDGKSGEYLRELGCKNVIHKEGVDFFNNEEVYDFILSNPPFSKSKEVMSRLAKLNKPFIMLMPSSKINTSYFRQNYMNKGLQIIIPRKRIHFIKLIDGKEVEGWKNQCAFDCFYYCYKLGLPNDITWLE